MSAFNESNELASLLVWGRHYCHSEPGDKLTKIMLERGDEQRVIPAPVESTHNLLGLLSPGSLMVRGLSRGKPR